MAERPVRDLTVGSVFALGLVILALAVMAVSNESGVLFERTEYVVRFDDATGLVVGAPVRMAGVEVGSVVAIRLPTDPGGRGIRVGIAVDPAYAERVRRDSRAALRILQFLTNEKFVEVTPGSPDSPALPEGAEIALLEDKGVLERGEAIADSLGEITVSLKKILEPIERGEGLIGRMITDPTFGERGLEALGSTLDNLQVLTAEVRAGRGAIGRLLGDDRLAAGLDDLAGTLEDFGAIVARIERGEGAVGELLQQDGAAQQALVDLRESAASLRRVTARLESDRGLLGRLLHDPDYSEAVARDLRTALAQLVEISAKLNRGEGTLGALINDRTLYDGAAAMLAGTNDSKFTQWLMRHYRKKGIKAQEEAQELEREERQAEEDDAPEP
jgi:phospholipid/cholesterol/gamma-HCH transport system substrate-binding protein